MRSDFKHYIRNCDIYQWQKHETLLLAGFLQPLLIPHHVLAEISMDFIEGLSLSHENSVLLVVVDGLSKYAQFMPISHPFIAAKMPRERDKFFL
jgi:hypothetical protein